MMRQGVRVIFKLTHYHPGALPGALREPRSERFCVWAVEGLLFLLALKVFAGSNF